MKQVLEKPNVVQIGREERWRPVRLIRVSARSVGLALIVGLGASLMGQIALAGDWMHYDNARFGTSAQLPSSFVADPAPANSDGQTFRPPNGRGTIKIYGAINSLSDSMTGYRNAMMDFYFQDGLELTYSPEGRGWFVLSGYIGGDIIYLRAEHGRGCRPELIHHIEFRYPAEDKHFWDAIVTKGAKSLDGPCF